MTLEEFRKDIAAGIPDVLPQPKAYEPEINHAPKRKDILTPEQKELALRNAIAGTSRNYFTGRGYMVVGGILDLILGILLCANPAVTLAIMPILLGIWMLYHSFMIIAFGGDMETFNLSGSGWTITGGVLLMLLSIMILVNPFSAGITAVIVLTGCGLIVFGILFCTLGIQLKDIHLKIEPELQ